MMPRQSIYIRLNSVYLNSACCELSSRNFIRETPSYQGEEQINNFSTERDDGVKKSKRKAVTFRPQAYLFSTRNFFTHSYDCTVTLHPLTFTKFTLVSANNAFF